MVCFRMLILGLLFQNNVDDFEIVLKTSSILFYSGIFYFCQYLHIGAGILSFGGDVFWS